MDGDPELTAAQAAVDSAPDDVLVRAQLFQLLHQRLLGLPLGAQRMELVTVARRHLGEILRREPVHPLVEGLLRTAPDLMPMPAPPYPVPPGMPAFGDAWDSDDDWDSEGDSDDQTSQSSDMWESGQGPLPPQPPPPGSVWGATGFTPPPRAESPPVPSVPTSSSGDDELPAGDPAEWERPGVTLDDVAGMDEVKDRLELVVFGPARRPDLAEAFGRAGRGGLLLWGPPGCGKTFLARAVAGHLGVQFAAVGIDAVLDRWLGSSERNLAALFSSGRQRPPCVLFLDEVDAIGQRRSRLRSEHLRTVMSQLLVELDGVDRDNRGLFVVGASNLPWDVDPALRRPGRFDRTVFVPPPDDEARARILADRLFTMPLDAIEIPSVVRRTAGFSGADVAHVADTAAELALAESIKGDTIVPVRQDHLEQAVGQIRPSISDWVATARDAATWADDESLFGPFLEWLDGWERRR